MPEWLIILTITQCVCVCVHGGRGGGGLCQPMGVRGGWVGGLTMATIFPKCWFLRHRMKNHVKNCWAYVYFKFHSYPQGHRGPSLDSNPQTLDPEHKVWTKPRLLMATETPLPTILMCKLLKNKPHYINITSWDLNKLITMRYYPTIWLKIMARKGLLCRHDNHMGISTEQCNSLVESCWW